MRDQIALARQANEMEALQQAYAPVLASLETHAPPSPEDAMALRCLMIHEWRRVALRVLAVPADLIEPQDREPETRALIAAIYARLLPASEAWLDANASTPEGTLPPADPRLARRFQPSRA